MHSALPPSTAARVPGRGAVKTPLVQTVHAAILEALDSGALQPGDRIVAYELAHRMGLSRAPVREALALLAGQGVVELHPDRGAILRPLTLGDLAGIYEVRGPIAAVGARAAARRIGAGDHAARLRQAMAAIREAGTIGAPGVGLFAAIDAYHRLLNAIGERPHVDFVLGAVHGEYLSRYLAQALDLTMHGTGFVAAYQRLTDAVLAGDGATAEAILRFHSDWCVRLLVGDAA